MLLKFVATTKTGARKCVFQLVSDTIDSIESLQSTAIYNEFDVILFSLLSFCDTIMQIHTIRASVGLCVSFFNFFSLVFLSFSFFNFVFLEFL